MIFQVGKIMLSALKLVSPWQNQPSQKFYTVNLVILCQNYDKLGVGGGNRLPNLEFLDIF